MKNNIENTSLIKLTAVTFVIFILISLFTGSSSSDIHIHDTYVVMNSVTRILLFFLLSVFLGSFIASVLSKFRNKLYLRLLIFSALLLLSAGIYIFLFFSAKKRTLVGSIAISKTWNIKLTNDLGNFEITLPKQYDTLFSWIQYSDCGDQCAKVDYRIQPKSLPFFKETGFMYYPLEDSVEQFTIKHAKVTYKATHTDSTLDTFFIERLKSKADNFDNRFLIDTIIKVDNREIAVIANSVNDTTKNIKIQELIATTLVQGNVVDLFFERRNKITDSTSTDFIESSFNAVKTIRISSVQMK